MARSIRTIYATCILLAACAASDALSQPQPVPRMVDRSLDKASYVELAKEWKKHIEKNGETADALVNLGMAYDYSEELDAALAAGQRAVEIDPDNPKALAFLAHMTASYGGDDDKGLELLLRCRRIAPDYEYGLITLAAVYLRRGELSEAGKVHKTMFDQRTIPQPLQDYAYNMLVGLPQGAVLITHGDNDTFPPLALQAGMQFREDVIVLNRSLMNLASYANAHFKLHPSIRPDYDIEGHVTAMTPQGKAELLSDKLIEKLIEEKKVSVYFTASQSSVVGFRRDPEWHLEGINLRAEENGLSAEESARLILDTYRLDSATDWSFSWALKPNLSLMMSNYAASMATLAAADGVSKETRRHLLAKASAIAEFHDLANMSQYVRSVQKKWGLDSKD